MNIVDVFILQLVFIFSVNQLDVGLKI